MAITGHIKVDLTDDEVFRIVASMRRRFRRAADYRGAVVAPSTSLDHLVDEFVGVRDMMVGQSAAVPPVRSFATPADAEAWLAEPDG